jgi:hypothetical protein
MLDWMSTGAALMGTTAVAGLATALAQPKAIVRVISPAMRAANGFVFGLLFGISLSSFVFKTIVDQYLGKGVDASAALNPLSTNLGLISGMLPACALLWIIYEMIVRAIAMKMLEEDPPPQ